MRSERYSADNSDHSLPVIRARGRVQARAAHIFATCAMGSWFLLGIIPVAVILYSMS
ncbi:hypothetical protein [Acetobacter indonesiensis]